MTRYAHVCTSHGVGMPAMSKVAAAEAFARAADAQLAKGRRKPVQTGVSRYVDGKQAALTKRLHKALRAAASRVAAKASRLYAERLAKDATSFNDTIARIIAELDNEELGVTLAGELEGAMLAAFKRAAAIGLTQAGIEADDGMTSQVDAAAVAFADARGAELIKDLAGTTDESMRALLARAVEDGLATDSLADAIMELGAFSESRAETIARTELAYAHVQGNLAGWRASGEVVGKRWVLGDLHDEPDECDDAAEMGVVGIDDDFGGLGDPPIHPRCVCDLIAVLRAEDSGE